MSRFIISSLGLLFLLGLASVNTGAQEPAPRTLGRAADAGSFLISDIERKDRSGHDSQLSAHSQS